MKRPVVPLGVGAVAALGLAYTAAARDRRAWSATGEEASRSLPGDELIPAPAGSLTHAITIRRPPREVWPWLVQMGADRAGWYSYDFVDNGGRPSLRHLDPRLQRIDVGSVIPALPGMSDGFTVLRVEPESALVLGWLPPGGGPPLTTWAFVLEESVPGITRLLVRSRAASGYPPPFGLPDWAAGTLVPWGHAVLQRKQLLGIRQRAESRREPGRLDELMPRYDTTLVRSVVVNAPPAATYAAIRRADILDPLIRGLFRIRELPQRAASRFLGEPRRAIPHRMTLQELLAREPETPVLAEEPGVELVVGSVGRYWERDYGPRPVTPSGFVGFAEPGYAKLAMSFRVEPLGEGRSRLRYEARTVTTDAHARRRFRRYWRLIRPGVALVMGRAVALMREEAESHRSG